MQEPVQQNNTTVYLAPLQGFTDFIYRKAYSETFQGTDVYFVPYISVKNNLILRKYENEILPENNRQLRVVPQVLANTAEEMLFLADILKNKGYNEINLNLGCPYPMVTNREKGAGLLPHPDKLNELLTSFFRNTDLLLSVKMRAGLLSAGEIEQVVPVLNQFPLTEVILHPRIAKQLYDGEILDSAFQFALQNLKHRLVASLAMASTSIIFGGLAGCWACAGAVIATPNAMALSMPARLTRLFIGSSWGWNGRINGRQLRRRPTRTSCRSRDCTAGSWGPPPWRRRPSGDGRVDRREQRLFVDGLAQIALRAAAERTDTGFHAVLTRDDDDRHGGVRRRHGALDVEAAGTGHVQVEQDAIGLMVFDG